jgi:peptidoglycan/xylan/chitin deacetylase (PgdA/CDA1 family)
MGQAGPRLTVLLYHDVGEPLPGAYPGLTVGTRRFEQHLRLLARLRRTPVHPRDLAGTLPPNPVLITFDDGYAGLTANALPLLRRYATPALLFAVSGHIGGTNAWDAQEGWRTQPLMGAEALSEWRTADMSVGSHTRTHPDLTKLAPDALEQELRGSREDLEGLLGEPVTTFAYPYGLHGAAARRQAAETYDFAFTTDQGLNTPHTHRSALKRTTIYPTDGPLRFVSRVLFGRDLTREALARLQSIQVRRRVANSQRSPSRTMRSS